MDFNISNLYYFCNQHSFCGDFAYGYTDCGIEYYIEILTDNSYYYLYNGHGDVVQVVDTSGNIVNSYDYDVWGNFLTKQETIDNHFTYFGQTYDETTGLYYLRARYYDPSTGRFTQKDPAEDGYNWYVYDNNNPVMYVEPSGEAVWLAALKLLVKPVAKFLTKWLLKKLLNHGWT